MKKSWKVALLLVSLIIVSIIYYRVTFEAGVRTWEASILATIITLLALGLLLLGYKGVIRRFGKGTIDKTDYVQLYDLERGDITGEIEFYYTTETPKHITFTIQSMKMEVLHTLVDGECSKGGNIVRFDTRKLEEGHYFYGVQTENQKAIKRFRVVHDKVAVAE